MQRFISSLPNDVDVLPYSEYHAMCMWDDIFKNGFSEKLLGMSSSLYTDVGTLTIQQYIVAHGKGQLQEGE